jgi:hypothetical protein
VTLTPVQTYLHPVLITPARLKFWLGSAQKAWGEMAGDPVPNFEACHGKWGPCEYIPACHVLDLDPDVMDTTYERIPPRDV